MLLIMMEQIVYRTIIKSTVIGRESIVLQYTKNGSNKYVEKSERM